MKNPVEQMARCLFALGLSVISSGAEELFLFSAEDNDHGREPWLHAGGENRFLGDLSPGANLNSVPRPDVIVPYKENVLFIGNDGSHGSELWAWRDDDLHRPEQYISDFDSMRPSPGIEFDDKLIFLGRKNTDSRAFSQIWSWQNEEFRCLLSGSSFHGPFQKDGLLFFLQFTDIGAAGPWSSAVEWQLISYDGSEFSEVSSGLSDFEPRRQASVLINGDIHTILLTDQSENRGLYRLDGEGAHPVVENVDADQIVVAGEKIYGFIAFRRGVAHSCWCFSGENVEDIAPSSSFDLSPFAGDQDQQVATALAGDRLLVKIRDILYHVDENQFVRDPVFSSVTGVGLLKTIGDTSYWHAFLRAGRTGMRGVVRLDPEGPVFIGEMDPGYSTGTETDFHVNGSMIYYGNSDNEWVVSDVAGITQLPLTPPLVFREPPASSNPEEGATLDGWYYFPATTVDNGTELWRSNGQCSEMVADLLDGPNGSEPRDLLIFKDRLYFTARANPSSADRTVLVFDGTSVEAVNQLPNDTQYLESAGGYLIAKESGLNSLLRFWDGAEPPFEREFYTVSFLSTGSVFKEYDDVVYFEARDSATGNEIWCFRDAAFEILHDTNPGADSSVPAEFTQTDDGFYWRAFHPDFGHELWHFDGIEVTMVADIAPATASPGLSSLTPIGEQLYFSAKTEAHGIELWMATGGTAQRVTDLEPGENSSGPSDIVGIGNDIYFSAYTSDHGRELWIIRNGSELERVTDLFPGPSSSNPRLELLVGTTAYYSASIPGEGRVLFEVSDGLAIEVGGIGEESCRLDPEFLGSHEGIHWFTARGELGREPYQLIPNSGEERSELRLIADLHPGPGSGMPLFLGVVNGLTLFAASSPELGRELAVISSPSGIPDADSQLAWLDLAPGRESLYPRFATRPSKAVEIPGAIVFSTEDHRIFRSDHDGTVELPLPAILENGVSINEMDFTEVDGTLYLSAVWDTWKRGTYVVEESAIVELTSDDGFVSGGTIIKFGDRAVMVGYSPGESSLQSGVWALRGGEAVKLEPPTPLSRPELFTEHNGWIYFVARGGPAPAKSSLFRTDSFIVERIALDLDPSLDESGGFLVSSGPNLYVATAIPNFGTPRFAVVTPTGATMIPGQIPGYLTYIKEQTPAAGNLYFVADFLTTGIFRVSPSGISVLDGINPFDLTIGGGSLFYSALIDNSRELLIHNLVSNETQVAPNTFFAPFSPNPSYLYYANDRLYMNGSLELSPSFSYPAGCEFIPPNNFRRIHTRDIRWWKAAGGGMIAGDRPFGDSPIVLLANGEALETEIETANAETSWLRWGDKLVTYGTHPDTGTELYVFDGEGLVLLKELVDGRGSANPLNLTGVRNAGGSFDYSHPFRVWLASQGIDSTGLDTEDLTALHDDRGYPMLIRYATGQTAADEARPVSFNGSGKGGRDFAIRLPNVSAEGVTLIIDSTYDLETDGWEAAATRLGSGTWITTQGNIEITSNSEWSWITVGRQQHTPSTRFFRLRAILSP